jgi:diguanylate cyclase (GGDEF)-like protein/PAS domain S-box-containing protein
VNANPNSISLQDLLQLSENVPAMLAVYDAATEKCVYSNRRYAALLGRAPEEIVGKTTEEIVGADAYAEIRPHLDRVLHQGRAVTYSRSLSLLDGSMRHLEVSIVPDDHRPVRRTYVLISDVSRYQDAERKLNLSAERLWKFMAASEEGIAFHSDGIVTDVNQALLDMLGYKEAEFVGRRTLDFVPFDEHDRVRAVIASGAEIAYESRAIHKTRGAIPVEYIVRDMEWSGIKQRMVIVRDLSERKATEQRIRFLALHDALSGLPNRASLDEHLAALTANPHQRPFATLFIDVDQLKRVNDSLGHWAGDRLLKELAERLERLCAAENAVESTAWLSRIGGDEYVLTYYMHDDADLARFVARVVDTFSRPIQIDHREIRISASIGVARFPRDGDTPTQLLKNADSAMYLAKTEGRDTVRYFDESLAKRADARLEIEQALIVALRESQFQLFFQPVFSSDGRQLIGAEALLRWAHPTRGLLRPDDFVEVAEEGQLIIAIGQWVLQEALSHAQRWIALGWHDARVSVNLSSNEFKDDSFTERVLAALSACNLTGAHLELEFTERMLMGHESRIRDSLIPLRKAGVSLAIDDFGTGFSSLSRLRALPIDTLKIDQSFVADIPESHSALAIITALLQLGRGLSIDVIAEGVETEAQRECLELLGCDAMQGYLFAEPMTGTEFAQWLRDHNDSLDTLPRVRFGRRSFADNVSR